MVITAVTRRILEAALVAVITTTRNILLQIM